MGGVVNFLIFLIFFSKISFKTLLPSELSFLILQNGLHPWMNLGLHALLAMPLLLQYQKIKHKISLCPQYLTTILLIGVGLVLLTALQFEFSSEGEWLVSMASLFFTLLLILFYGALIPQMFPVEFFLRRLFLWSFVFVVLSILLWLGAQDLSFKGGRFIGVFKHIPYMVTTSTLLVFTGLFYLDRSPLKFKPLFLFAVLAGLFTLVLTGTRSATAICLVLILFYFFKFMGRLKLPRLMTTSFFAVLMVLTGYFAGDIIVLGTDLIQGKSAFMYRQAQNGIEDRIDEIRRGLEHLDNPWVGQGLGFKYSNASDGPETDLKYSSFNDPHNYFISSMVVGGYPLLALCTILFLYLTFKSARGVFLVVKKNTTFTASDLLHLFVFANLPILLIYHVHLSIGGMADRIYWLAFGLMAQQISSRYYKKNEEGYDVREVHV